MFNACGLCCTQRWRMGSSPLISNKWSLETRQAQHRSTSSKVWSDVDTDVCPGPSTVCSWASHRLLTESQWVQRRAHSALNYLFGMPVLVAVCACIQQISIQADEVVYFFGRLNLVCCNYMVSIWNHGRHQDAPYKKHSRSPSVFTVVKIKAIIFSWNQTLFLILRSAFLWTCHSMRVHSVALLSAVLESTIPALDSDHLNKRRSMCLIQPHCLLVALSGFALAVSSCSRYYWRSVCWSIKRHLLLPWWPGVSPNQLGPNFKG